MTETQHDPNAAQPEHPRWRAPQPPGQGTVLAREGEYAWQGSGQQPPAGYPPAWGAPPRPADPIGAQPIDPNAPAGSFGSGGQIPGALPGPGHAAEPRRRARLKFGLGVVSAFVILAAGVGGVAGAYFGSHNSSSSAVVTSITGANTSSSTTN